MAAVLDDARVAWIRQRVVLSLEIPAFGLIGKRDSHFLAVFFQQRFAAAVNWGVDQPGRVVEEERL